MTPSNSSEKRIAVSGVISTNAEGSLYVIRLVAVFHVDDAQLGVTGEE